MSRYLSTAALSGKIGGLTEQRHRLLGQGLPCDEIDRKGKEILGELKRRKEGGDKARSEEVDMISVSDDDPVVYNNERNPALFAREIS